MAIGSIHVEWLSRLARKGILGTSYSLLDLGPQDVQVSRSYMTEVARRHLDRGKTQRTIDAVFDGEAPRPDGQQAFYSVFGCESYASVDLLDKRATYRFDLNNATPDIGSFDVVTNFGTIEHVFDIGQAFRSLHGLVKPGGVSLHCMPAFAFIDHGFYNIHPILFVELATANAYDIVDFSYVDNMFVRNSKHGAGVFDFDKLPIKLADTNNTQLFMSKVVDQFRHNIETTPREAVHGYSAFIFDLLFVALRRTDRSPAALRPAIQGAFASGGAMATDA
ncbi:MAG TPA: methyltransferase domain-containing protein [Bradyrhizobium sp.]|nr:methyltransferase domain-containing protein [Bradyrhizobium sp.]